MLKIIGLAFIIIGILLLIFTLISGSRNRISETRYEYERILSSGYALEHTAVQARESIYRDQTPNSPVMAAPRKRVLSKEGLDLLEKVESQRSEERGQMPSGYSAASKVLSGAGQTQGTGTLKGTQTGTLRNNGTGTLQPREGIGTLQSKGGTGTLGKDSSETGTLQRGQGSGTGALDKKAFQGGTGVLDNSPNDRNAAALNKEQPQASGTGILKPQAQTGGTGVLIKKADTANEKDPKEILDEPAGQDTSRSETGALADMPKNSGTDILTNASQAGGTGVLSAQDQRRRES